MTLDCIVRAQLRIKPADCHISLFPLAIAIVKCWIVMSLHHDYRSMIKPDHICDLGILIVVGYDAKTTNSFSIFLYIKNSKIEVDLLFSAVY